jgi:uncharacterized ferritin-like protein (DUF455 family)
MIRPRIQLLSRSFAADSPENFIRWSKISVKHLLTESTETDERLEREAAVDLVRLDCIKPLDMLTPLPAGDLERYYKNNNVSPRNRIVNNLLNIEHNAVIGYQLMLVNYLKSDKLPDAFYSEGLNVIKEEISHFEMLEEYFQSQSLKFGDLPVNSNIINDLKLCENLIEHVALISLAHEGKGVDAGPRLLQKLKAGPDQNRKLHDIVAKIVADEEKHVEFGVRWFKHLCAQADSDPKVVYAKFMKKFGLRIFRPNIPVRKRINFDFVDY